MPAPETSKFATLPFPFCSEEVDVSVYDFWTTLSGFNKDSTGSPDDASIRLSKDRAMKLFWKLYSVTATFTEDTTATFTANNVDHLEDGVSAPRDKICRDPDATQDRTRYGTRFGRNEDAAGGNCDIDANFYGSTGLIVRMMNGSEFVGYGVRGSISIGYTNGELPAPNTDINLISYADESSFDELKYVTFEGINFLAASYGSDGFSSDISDYTFDLDNLTVSYDNGTIQFTISLDSLDFYETFT